MANTLTVFSPNPLASISGTVAVSFSVPQGLANVEVKDQDTLATGDTSVSVPAGTQWAIIYPPTGNTTVLTQRSTGQATGQTINKTGPSLVNFDTANLPANLIINSAGGFAGAWRIVFG